MDDLKALRDEMERGEFQKDWPTRLSSIIEQHEKEREILGAVHGALSHHHNVLYRDFHFGHSHLDWAIDTLKKLAEGRALTERAKETT